MCGTKKMLLIFIILLQAPPMLNRPLKIPATKKQILYVLTLQWGISFCREYPRVDLCKQSVAQNFTIHGLWLLYDESGATSPPSAAGRDLFKSDVDGVLGLNESWPSHLARVTNFQLWRDQWSKHGQYLGLQPRRYFQKAVELKKKVDDMLGGSLAHFFIGKGLRPSETELYDADSFLDQIKITTNFITQMQCNTDMEENMQLYEIRFCFNDRWEWRNCPGYNQPSYPRNKQGANSYPKRGPNSQRKSPPPPPPPPPSFQIGRCIASERILFPALIPAPPPPPPPPPHTAPPPPPPPPSKSPPLRRKQWPPPPPSAQTPLKAPLPPAPSLPSSKAATFAQILIKGLQQSPLPHPPHTPPPPPPPPPPPSKSPPLRRKQWPPPPPSPQKPLKAPLPPAPSLPSYPALTFTQILVKGRKQSPPASSALPPPDAKRGRRWRPLLKRILTLIIVLIQLGILRSLRK